MPGKQHDRRPGLVGHATVVGKPDGPNDDNARDLCVRASRWVNEFEVDELATRKAALRGDMGALRILATHPRRPVKYLFSKGRTLIQNGIVVPEDQREDQR